jgi:ATP-binding protein involved in chromosome partitioning
MSAFEKVTLEGVKKIIVVASGKGGVGKSTISANLAVGLARNGYKTALVDADIFGPSIPKMFGIENANPEVTHLGDKEVMFPVEKYGVKIMSIGFFVKKNQGLIWRGPMAANAIMQLFESSVWGDIDYLIVDFPPGTSDIQLTTIQKLHIAGAIIVTTPQEVAVNDARKAASMFNNSDLNVPILGVVENMAWFTPASHPDEKYFIFGKNGGEALSLELGTKLLAQIPLVAEVSECSDNGSTIFNTNNPLAINAFEKLTDTIVNSI